MSVIKYIKPENKDLLDAGCGSGIFSRELVLRGFNVTGVDLDEDAIENCNNGMKQLNLDCTIVKESIMDLKSFKDETFDVVICSIVVGSDLKSQKNLA